MQTKTWSNTFINLASWQTSTETRPGSPQPRKDLTDQDKPPTRGGRGCGFSGPAPSGASRARPVAASRRVSCPSARPVPPRLPRPLGWRVCGSSAAGRIGQRWRTPGKRLGAWRQTFSGRSSQRPRKGAWPSLSVCGVLNSLGSHSGIRGCKPQALNPGPSHPLSAFPPPPFLPEAGVRFPK